MGYFEAKIGFFLCSTFQHWMRGRLQRIRFLRLLESVKLLQSMLRWYNLKRNKADATIQAAVRRWLTEKAEQRKLAAVVRAQVHKIYCIIEL